MVKLKIEDILKAPEGDIDNQIEWHPGCREHRTKFSHAISYGYYCSNCKNFEMVKKKFCSACGGHYDGSDVFKFVENRRRSKKKWQ